MYIFVRLVINSAVNLYVVHYEARNRYKKLVFRHMKLMKKGSASGEYEQVIDDDAIANGLYKYAQRNVGVHTSDIKIESPAIKKRRISPSVSYDVPEPETIRRQNVVRVSSGFPPQPIQTTLVGSQRPKIPVSLD
jgi:hypothetical protein